MKFICIYVCVFTCLKWLVNYYIRNSKNVLCTLFSFDQFCTFVVLKKIAKFNTCDFDVWRLKSRNLIPQTYICQLMMKFKLSVIPRCLRFMIRNFAHQFRLKITKFNTCEIWHLTLREMKYLQNLVRIIN